MALRGRVHALLTSGSVWAMVASGTSVALALLRELLIVRALNFSAINDALQAYLTMVYVVSLLNEAVRLGAINILQKSPFRSVAVSILPFGVLWAISVCTLTYYQLGATSILLTIGAGISGVLNMVMILMVTQRQRSGKFWAAHLISLVPNLLLIPGIVAVAMLKPSDPVPPLAALYYLLPVIQITMLLFVKPGDEPINDDPETVQQGTKTFLAHSTAAVGSFLFQAVARPLALQMGEGELSKLSILIRVYDSVRFVFVDTLIGRKLATWRESGTLEAVRRTIRLLALPQILLTAAGLVVALAMPGIAGAFIVLLLSVGGFGLRMVYFMLNSATVDRRMAVRYGLQDIGTAIVLAVCVRYGLTSMALLVWLWYALRPLVQLLIVKKSLQRLDPEVT